ncbi:SUMF1/EgtB/PvdO family nonheme iron enzyme [Pseudomonas benzenivorans]|uniref:SUMF1/EgtB/PvdO family nonheme iron enzyme n=1 Tax=Pseudomonas benzenivorans TaxID=556533 RepID=A0ABZ0PW71_9PSED|nr:SUMF1/EgtB/PvdO family nonheme iron enzyme [Pseudomonas benzenivorans]WPC05427.1 SUMF1/EgtB/PvdO family nonheme iron enzyme [Pseudomonas benzenivorans]
MTAEEFAHWPLFEERLSTDLSDRQLMGLPEHFQATRAVAQPLPLWRELALRSSEALCACLEDPATPLPKRLVAGKLLAETGDPRINALAPPMIEVPGGVVRIGLAAEAVDDVMQALAGLGLDRDWIVKETPCHESSLRTYRIGRYPVTNQEYRAFLEDSRQARLPTSWAFGQFPTERANHPVYGVRAEDADAYVAWLAARTGRAFRLPSEAEWEYAAAGPDRLEFPWGNRFLSDHANTAETGLFATTAVGTFPAGASPFGCLDMAGNVEEYVADDYRPYPGGQAIEDDLVRVVGSHRVARGGSFTRFRDLARNSRRHGKFPRDIYVMGFRLAEDL